MRPRRSGISRLLYQLLCHWNFSWVQEPLRSCVRRQTQKKFCNNLHVKLVLILAKNCMKSGSPAGSSSFSPFVSWEQFASVPAVTEQYSSPAFSMQSLSWTSCAKHNFALISNSGEIFHSQFTGCRDIAGFCILFCVKIHGHRYPLRVVPLLRSAAVRN